MQHYKKSLWIQNIGVVHERDKYHEHIKKTTLNSVTSRARNSVHTREIFAQSNFSCGKRRVGNNCSCG